MKETSSAVTFLNQGVCGAVDMKVGNSNSIMQGDGFLHSQCLFQDIMEECGFGFGVVVKTGFAVIPVECCIYKFSHLGKFYTAVNLYHPTESLLNSTYLKGTRFGAELSCKAWAPWPFSASASENRAACRIIPPQ